MILAIYPADNYMFEHISDFVLVTLCRLDKIERKREILIQNNIRTPQICRLQTGLIIEMKHANHILRRRFRGPFQYHNMDR